MSDTSNEEVYLNSLRDILENGKKRSNRTGIWTFAQFAKTMTFDLTESFPLLTVKKVPFKSIVSELLWFLEGSTDERRLVEIRYGKPRSELKDKRTIWTDNLESPAWTARARFEGDLGPVYGQMFRKYPTVSYDENGIHCVRYVDQVRKLIDGIVHDPYGRRHIINNWNPGMVDHCALPPCHVLTQFNVDDGYLDCLLFQRSADFPIGIPFNIASYALFTMMIAQVCGLKARALTIMTGDSHIYENAVVGVLQMLDRKPLPPPTVKLDPSITDIDDFTMDSFELLNYESHGPIQIRMAV